jgi:hypothetical protein
LLYVEQLSAGYLDADHAHEWLACVNCGNRLDATPR